MIRADQVLESQNMRLGSAARMVFLATVGGRNKWEDVKDAFIAAYPDCPRPRKATPRTS